MGMRSGRVKGPWTGPVAVPTPSPSSPGPFPYWFKFSITHVDLQGGATSALFPIYTMPARSVLHAVIMRPTIAFAGVGITSYKLGCGHIAPGAMEAYLARAAADGAVNGFNHATSLLATVAEDWLGAFTVYASGFTVGANTNASTAGAADYWLLVSRPTA